MKTALTIVAILCGLIFLVGLACVVVSPFFPENKR